MVADMEVDKVAYMVSDIKGRKKVADMELDMVAAMEVDKVVDKGPTLPALPGLPIF